jgi:DNA-directed RNA polymerase subunit beta'
MKQFHTGAIAGAASNVMTSIDRLTQLLKIPQRLPDSSILAPISGKVTSITKSSAGGYDIKVGNSEAYSPASRALIVKKGDIVKKGQQLTDGLINPRELLDKTNIETVQRYLTDEIFKVFESEGVKRRNVEVVVKSLTNLGVIESGSAEGLLRGDYISLSYANALKAKGNTLNVEPVLRGIETLPLDQTTDWIARLQYRKLKETFIRGASEGWESDIHGLHPAPGMAYSAEFGRKDKITKGPY